MIQRIATVKIKQLANYFKALAIIGPRQSGKTTLVKTLFAAKPYISLEDPDNRRYAIEDPRGFLGAYPKGAVLDEVQRIRPGQKADKCRRGNQSLLLAR